MSVLTPRLLYEQNFPPDQRDWARTSIIQPLNRFMSEASALASGQLTLADNSTAQLIQFQVTTPNDWVSVSSFQNSFSAWSDASYDAAAFRKRPDGIVELTGLVTLPNPLPAGGSTIFALPSSAYFPAKNKGPFLADANDAAASIAVLSNGNVVWRAGGTAAGFLNLACQFAASDSQPLAPSCFPVYIRANFQPKGVSIWQALDWAQPRSKNRPIGLDWEYVSKSDGNYVKINNMPGLLPSKKYSITLMAFGG